MSFWSNLKKATKASGQILSSSVDLLDQGATALSLLAEQLEKRSEISLLKQRIELEKDSHFKKDQFYEDIISKYNDLIKISKYEDIKSLEIDKSKIIKNKKENQIDNLKTIANNKIEKINEKKFKLPIDEILYRESLISNLNDTEKLSYEIGEKIENINYKNEKDKNIIINKNLEVLRYKINEEFYPSNKIKKRLEIRDGKAHGKYELWYENEERQLISNFINGKPTGVFQYWYEDGNLAVSGEYNDLELNSNIFLNNKNKLLKIIINREKKDRKLWLFNDIYLGSFQKQPSNTKKILIIFYIIFNLKIWFELKRKIPDKKMTERIELMNESLEKFDKCQSLIINASIYK